MGVVTRGRRRQATYFDMPVADAGQNQAAEAVLNEDGKMAGVIQIDLTASTPAYDANDTENTIAQFKLYDVVDGVRAAEPFSTPAGSSSSVFVNKPVGIHYIQLVAVLGNGVENMPGEGELDERVDIMKFTVADEFPVADAGPNQQAQNV